MATKNKLKKKKFKYVPRPTRLQALSKSIKINYLFYICILISALLLRYDKQNTKSLKCIIISFILNGIFEIMPLRKLEKFQINLYHKGLLSNL